MNIDHITMTREHYRHEVRQGLAQLFNLLQKKVILTMTLDEILAEFDLTFEENFEYRILQIERLDQLCQEDTTALEKIRIFIKNLLLVKLPTKKSVPLNTTLFRLIKILSEDEQRQFGLMFIEHPQKNRRKIGAKLLTNIARQEDSEIIISSFSKYSDRSVLLPFAFSKLSVVSNARVLVENIGDHLLQGRIFEKLLQEDKRQAIELGKQFQAALSYGIGRTKDATFKEILLETCVSYNFDYRNVPNNISRDMNITNTTAYFSDASEILRLTIWALSKIGANEDLLMLRNLYYNEIIELDNS